MDRITDFETPVERKIFFVPSIFFEKDHCLYRLTGDADNWVGRILPGQTIKEGVAQELKETIGYSGLFRCTVFRDTTSHKDGNLIERYKVDIDLLDEIPNNVTYAIAYDLFGCGWLLQDYLDLFQDAGQAQEILFETELDYNSDALIVRTTTGLVLLRWGDEMDMDIEPDSFDNFQVPYDHQLRPGATYAKVTSLQFLSLKEPGNGPRHKYYKKTGNYGYVLTALKLKNYTLHDTDRPSKDD